jgi:flagellar M-ring protein FliF
METITQFFKNLSTPKLVAIMGGMIFFISMVIVFFLRISQPTMLTLYNDLNLEDSNKIIKELESRGVPYELSGTGSIIKVPEDKVLRLRMEMAEKGIPSKGSIVGYEIFDSGEGLGTSNFLQNVNLVRALEGELSRTISSFESIEHARVHLVLPKREVFSREKQKPRASVVLKMQGHKSLQRGEIDAITHLIATSVSDLDVDQVTIVDTKGRSLKLGARDSNDPNVIANENNDYKINYENRLKSVIEDMLEQSVGVGRVKAYVSVDMNFDKVVTNSENYDPEGQVARSVQTNEEQEKTNEEEQGVNAENNLPQGGGEEGEEEGPTSSSQSTSEVTNYEISKTVKNYIKEVGEIQRMSIAVAVDGKYGEDQNGVMSYQPRNDEELQKYKTLVKSAVGFKENRGDVIEVVNMQFVNDLEALKEETLTEWMKKELPRMAQTLVIGIVVVLVLMLVIRPIALKAFEISKEDVNVNKHKDKFMAMAEEQTPGEGESAVDNLKEAMLDVSKLDSQFQENQKIKNLNDVLYRYPEESLNLLRNWLNEG